MQGNEIHSDTHDVISVIGEVKFDVLVVYLVPNFLKCVCVKHMESVHRIDSLKL